MSAFVGTYTVDSAEELRSLLESLKTEKSYFFLRWPHQVSGFCQSLPVDFPSPEGQIFDDQKELRWQKQGESFSLLLLNEDGIHENFQPLGKTWLTKIQPAHLYRKNETRFPKKIHHQPINLGQRYFIDVETSTVHFVALTIL
jgi:hypothetical protein